MRVKRPVGTIHCFVPDCSKKYNAYSSLESHLLKSKVRCYTGSLAAVSGLNEYCSSRNRMFCLPCNQFHTAKNPTCSSAPATVLSDATIGIIPAIDGSPTLLEEIMMDINNENLSAIAVMDDFSKSTVIQLLDIYHDTKSRISPTCLLNC